MWLYTQLGFVSIVQKDADNIHIRSRSREVLEALAHSARVGEPIPSFPRSDCPWRIICPAPDLPRFMSALSICIDFATPLPPVHRALQTCRLPRHPPADDHVAKGTKNLMRHQTSVQDLLFDVDQVPVEAVVGSNGNTRHIAIPGKKALVNQRTGLVLGVVSRDYRVVTNQEAVSIAHDVCQHAFPGISPVEWEAKRAAAPRTLSYAFIDLVHGTHVLN